MDNLIPLGKVTAPDDELEGGLLNLSEAAHFYGVDYRLIWAWAHARVLHPVRPGRRWLYPEWELEQLVAELRGMPVNAVRAAVKDVKSSTATYLRRLEPAASAA
jgi:hypothetical protein